MNYSLPVTITSALEAPFFATLSSRIVIITFNLIEDGIFVITFDLGIYSILQTFNSFFLL